MNRFQETRAAHSRELAEDYVELVDSLIRESGEARVSEMADRLGVSPVTVSKTIQRLMKEGLVVAQPYRSIFLTEAGSALAQAVRERHDLVLAFLLQLGVSPRVAEVDSEGIEHHVSQETIEAMRQFLAARASSRSTTP
ncbi:MAG TPA: manganese-binding transcriptional regulator MntR [Fimbriimonadaceae bacterium]|nr:manganese-binding transcriptional regulator MntR [Fimbriimonadaceae bacterium]HRJ32845.1 manganese-binding transcriptional regulator MntR [Fimbriimonadaceae bacterium]